MERSISAKWLRSTLGTALLITAVHGCGQADLSGYSPAGQQQGSHLRATPPNRLKTVPKLDTTANDAKTNNKSDASTQVVKQAHASELDSVTFEALPVSALVPVNVIDGANVGSLMRIPGSEQNSVSGSVVGRRPESSDVVNLTEPRKVEVLVKEKTFRIEPKTGASRVSFDDLDLLKVLNMEPVVDTAVELMPDWLRGLNGKTIRIRGFMYPTYDTEGIEHFVMARDNQICCFRRYPKIYDLVQVDMKPGKTTNYIPATRAFDVVGTFRIKMQSDGGKPYGLYVIEQANVIEH